jgi:hypothetical protein
MKTTTTEFIRLISQAIDHMQSRSYARAIANLRGVLSGIKVATSTSEEQRHADQDCKMSDLPLELISLRDSFDANQTLYADQNAFSFYDGAIGIFATEANPAWQLQMSVIVLYNIGLAFHLKALQDATKSQDRFLPQALRCYRMAMSLLQKRESCRNNLLRMALYNNMGHIHLLSLDEKSAHLCVESLRRLLAVEMATNQTKSAEYAHFRINILVLEGGGHNRVSASAA